MKINKVLENDKVKKYLEGRNLIKQYKKSKNYLLQGRFFQIDFKLRKPKSERVWYFRINKQYRALGYFDDGDFIVFRIDDHQN